MEAHSALDAEGRGSNPRPPAKFCKRCETTKPLSDFNKRYDRDDVQHFCRDCNSEYGKEWHRKNKKRRVEAAMRRKRELRKWFHNLKQGRACDECGWTGHPAAMHYHHRDPEKKEFTISAGIERYSKTKILEEIEKCEFLCSNCHAIKTWGGES